MKYLLCAILLFREVSAFSQMPHKDSFVIKNFYYRDSLICLAHAEKKDKRGVILNFKGNFSDFLYECYNGYCRDTIVGMKIFDNDRLHDADYYYIQDKKIILILSIWKESHVESIDACVHVYGVRSGRPLLKFANYSQVDQLFFYPKKMSIVWMDFFVNINGSIDKYVFCSRNVITGKVNKKTLYVDRDKKKNHGFNTSLDNEQDRVPPAQVAKNILKILKL